jgi:Uma2 family endonuclease
MTSTIERTPSLPPGRVRWTRESVEALQQGGFLEPDRRYEVIDGEIIEMSDNPPHRAGVILLHAYLVSLFTALRAYSQAAVQVSTTDPARNNPIPDVSVTRQEIAAYFGRFPGPDDLLFIGEVSDTTLTYDLGDKALLYARAGIPEYWVLDIKGRRLIVHRHPEQNGYADIRVCTEDEEAATLLRPEAKVRVSDLLPTGELSRE